MRPLTFTTYPGARQAQGTPQTRTWEEWVHDFKVREIREQKDGPALVLGDISRGKRRSASNVRAAHAIGVDVEKLSEARIEEAFEALAPFEYFAWTTHSSAPSALRLRVVLPFAEPIEPSDYPHVWAGLNALLGGANDPQTKDISRLHYTPSCPPGAEHNAAAWRHAGRWISAADLPDAQITLDAQPSDPDTDFVAARRLASKIRARLKVVRADDPMKPLAKALLDDDPLAESGSRHRAIVEITWWIAEKTRDVPVAALNELFAGTLAAMRRASPGDSPTLEEVVDAYRGAVQKIEEGKRQARDREEQERKRRAREAQISAAGGRGPYDEEDLERIAHAQGWEPQELRDRWIIQREGMHWMLDAQGTYRGPYPKEDASIVASRILARAPVRLTEFNRNGVSYRPLGDVVRESGQVAERVVSDMVAQNTHYDPSTMVLYEAVRPLRPLAPAFDEEIDRWLRLLGGPQYPRLVDWLSCVPDLSKLLCAVYFDGEAGSGKTLLPTGLARLWTEGPPGDIELALSDFNDEIARCPLILADEDIPRPYRTATVTTKLRAMISTLRRTLKRKFKPPTELHGAVRLVLAANNEFLLESKGVSSPQDLDAIAQRFLYVSVSRDAAEMMGALPRATKQAWADEGIARHTLWLRDNHQIKEPGKRFWVEGDVSQMHRLLMTGSRWNSLVCEWLVRYLMEPNLFDSKSTGLVRRGEGELLVNDQAVIDGWELYVKNTKAEPETAKVGAALRAIAASARRRQLRHKGQRIRYRAIDVDHLLAWSDRHNIGDRQQILEAVGVGQEPLREPGDDEPPVEEFGTLPTANDKGVPF